MDIIFSDSYRKIVNSIQKYQAYIEFKLDGTILAANEKFLELVEYSLDEIVNKHHRIFVAPIEASDLSYFDFWNKFSRGECDSGQYKLVTKSGRDVWVEASYNPIFLRSKPYKVVTVATDITSRTLKAEEDKSKLDAISRAQAIIEFWPDGKVITANENFLRALGYRLDEIEGRHHSMFCDSTYVASLEYQMFWQRLANGESIADEFMRLGKGGREKYIQASYNPIFDTNGNVKKIVKFATDVTERVRNVNRLADALQALSEGNLRQEISQPFLPALERLRVDYNTASQKLRMTMYKVLENAGAIADAAQEIKTASNELAKRTEQQAVSVEQTAAALDGITTTVVDTSTRAFDAGKLVQNTMKNAEYSGKVIDQAIEAMGKIKQSASEISKITGLIDEIAFQTNLLALNAGVEAARAGDAGKGFAVVAHEVRELAQRSAKAAMDIEALIKSSSEQVKSGVALVHETGTSLHKIVEQVVKVDRNVTAIVEASREQSNALKEINVEINAVDQRTQQNAAMAEETNAAAQNLMKEADRLFNTISQFDIDVVPSIESKNFSDMKSKPSII